MIRPILSGMSVSLSAPTCGLPSLQLINRPQLYRPALQVALRQYGGCQLGSLGLAVLGKCESGAPSIG